MKKQPNNDEIIKMFKKKKKVIKQQRQIVDPPKIKNIHELRQLIERLKPSEEEENEPIVIDASELALPKDDAYNAGPVVIPQAGGQSTLRKTLLEGFEIIKNQNAYFEMSAATLENDDDYGGYPPAIAHNPDIYDTWVDRFIRNNLGGKREGLFIVWNLPSGKWKLDPWSCQLEKVDAS
jgi:hypothetical protein